MKKMNYFGVLLTYIWRNIQEWTEKKTLKGCQRQLLLVLFLSILYYLKVNRQSKLVSCNNKNQSSGNKKDSNA